MPFKKKNRKSNKAQKKNSFSLSRSLCSRKLKKHEMTSGVLKLNMKPIRKSHVEFPSHSFDNDFSKTISCIDTEESIAGEEFGMIKQFLTDVHWQNIDYLIIDTPPGTSDEHITIMENLRDFQNKKAVLVTTPQVVAVQDVRKEITFCRKTGLPILGIIENMSTFVCPHCSKATNIFSKGGGESLADAEDIKFLGRLPLDKSINDLADSGKSLLNVYSKSESAKFFNDIVNKIIESNNSELSK